MKERERQDRQTERQAEREREKKGGGERMHHNYCDTDKELYTERHLY